MILDLSDQAFRCIMQDRKLALPIRWDGSDFEKTVDNHLSYYIEKIREKALKERGKTDLHIEADDLEKIKAAIVDAICNYLNGLPVIAYYKLRIALELLILQPLKIYQKSVTEIISSYPQDDPLHLFRAVRVEDNKPYPRERIFHTPYNLRSKVSTNRYSIAGHPSLYLGTSLELCCSELHTDPMRELTLASAFRLDRNIENTIKRVQIIELGIKPQDFIQSDNETARYLQQGTGRTVSDELIRKSYVKEAYLLWYPLIAACSYIRVNKKDPFAAEYIIPQLLMQWIRYESKKGRNIFDKQLFGIRYFSCASVKASDMGFNYVFPTSGERISDNSPYCKMLANAFYLTEPIYVHENASYSECEQVLNNHNFQKII